MTTHTWIRPTWLLLWPLALAPACGSSGSEGDEDARDGLDTLPADLPDDPGPSDVIKDSEVTPDADVPDLPDGAETVDSAVQAVLDRGRYWLVNAEPWMAREAFEEALSLAPGNPDALYGAALGYLVYGAERMIMILQMAPGQALGFPPPPEGFFAGDLLETENDWLAGAIRELLAGLRDDFAQAATLFDQAIEAWGDDDPAWALEKIPFHAGVGELLVFRGTHHRADVALVRTVNDTFLWLGDLLAAQDFHTDAMTVIGLARDLDDIDLWGILDLAAYLLDQDPRFLTLDAQDGLPFADDGLVRLATIGRHYVEALDALTADEPSDDGVAWLDPDAPADTFVVGARVFEVASGVVEERPLKLRVSKATVEKMRTLAEQVATPGAIVPWDEGALVQLATLIVPFAKSGLLDLFGGAKLPLDLSGLEVDQALVLLKNLLPSALALDWGTFHQDPVGLRALLPLIAGAGEGEFLFEWECPDEIAELGQPGDAAGLVCTKGATLVDAPHFVGTPYEIAADGVASRLPYLVWEDPTWGGLLFVDPTRVAGAQDVEPGYAPADNRTLNLAVHALIGGILDMFL